MLKSLLLLLTFLIATSAFTCNHKEEIYTQDDILLYLDHIETHGLPSMERTGYPSSIYEQGTIAGFLEPPYTYTSGSRMTLFADKTRWAIVLEQTGFCTANYNIEIETLYLGNCVKKERSTIGLAEIADVNTLPADRLSINIRGKDLPVEHNAEKYRKIGIRVPEDGIDLREITRYLDETNHELFRATEAELRKGLPADLPMLMHIDHWCQVPIEWVPVKGRSENKMLLSKPSSYETYRMISEVLETRDTSRWKPTLVPNNNWRNWPEAGGM